MPPQPLTVSAVLAASRAKESRLQALSPVFSRLAERLSEAAKSLCSQPIKFSFEGFDANCAKSTVALPMDAILTCQAHAGAWSAVVTLGFDRPLLSAITEAMFGGSGEELPYQEERPLSHIEKRIAREIQETTVHAMMLAFQPVAETDLVLIAEKQTDAAFDQKNVPPPDIFARFLAHLWGYSGEFLVGLPKSVVLMLQDKLHSSAPAAPAPRPANWNGQIRRQISGADVTLTAVLSEIDLPLDGITQLQKGQVIKLIARLGEPVKLLSDGETLFNCALGQSQGRYVVSIEGLPQES